MGARRSCRPERYAVCDVTVISGPALEAVSGAMTASARHPDSVLGLLFARCDRLPSKC